MDVHRRTILGIRFHTGGLEDHLVETARGGLIVAPSAPVLVALTGDKAHRAAVEASDFAISDSAFLVMLWLLLKGERIPRVSGLKFLRALVRRPDFQEPGATFWIMPTVEDGEANRRWLSANGVSVDESDCYLAPNYGPGALEDPVLLARIELRRPKYVVICLGGGVQERLGHYLRTHLSAFSAPNPASGAAEVHLPAPVAAGDRAVRHPSAPQPGAGGLVPVLTPPPRRPAILCTGAAIAFLSGRQANIPPWADRIFLGWFLRTLRNPVRFVPRYIRAFGLVPLLLRHGENSVAAAK